MEFCRYTTLFFGDIFCSNVYIIFHEYVNETIVKYYRLDKGLCHSNKLAPCLLILMVSSIFINIMI